jgi:DNA transposition AAA+ family ATPase
LEREIAVGRTPVLLLDEAQGLSPHQLDEVRSLSNLELPGRKLLEMILAGQPSLERVLAKREYAALRQRVAVRTYILPFDREHTAAYIEHRLRVAGAHQRPIFTAAAIAAIHSRSGGIPRLINLICERALLVSFAEDLKVVDLYQVEQAFSELRTEQDSEASTVPGPDLQVNEKALRRLESRFDALEEKIDRLGRALARAGLVPVDEADRVAPPAGIEPPLPRPSEPAADDVSADPADLSKRLIP